MGLLQNIKEFRSVTAEEHRVIGGVPWRLLGPWDNPLWRFDIGGPVHPSRAYYGADAALGLPALYAGTKIIADGAASLPIRVYTNYRGNDGLRRHRLYEGPTFFDKPSVIGTPFDWVFTGIVSLILHGNAWGLITGRDGYGFPTGIEWIPPEHVWVEDDQRQPMNPMRTKVFVYGREMTWSGPEAELFHVKAFAMPGRLEGLSLLKSFALTIMAGQEAQRYGTDWYRSGGFPPGVFRNKEIEIDPDQSAQIRSMLVSSLRRREPLVYGRDWDFTPITCPPNEAQFLDTMQVNATQIAALLNLPPDRVGGKRGDSLTYSTQQQSTLQIIEALRPWLVRLEHAFSDLLPRNRFVRFYTDALLKTDLETRVKIYQIQRNIGLRTVDEIRELEDLAPFPGDAGNEPMPLELMNALGQRAGALPKSMLSQVVLMMDLAADRLTKMNKDHPELVAPLTQQPAHNPEALVGNMITSYARSLAKDPVRGWDDDTLFLRQLGDRAMALRSPEYLGAWIPDARKHVNGHGGDNE